MSGSSGQFRISRRAFRTFFGAVLVGLLLVLVVLNVPTGAGTGQSDDADQYAAIKQQADLPMADREPVVAPRNHTTVLTSHLNMDGELIALAPDGRVSYYDDSNTGYWDVDPSPHDNWTISYATAEKITDESSGCEHSTCIRTYVEEANLTTGETRVAYARVYPGYRDTEWHDADWIDETHLLVAGISGDRVFIVNTTTGMTTWQWEAESHYELTEGRAYPEDWTHLNDVEYLGNGRIMASLRGMDEVVFIDRERGVLANWTLGEEGNYSILRGQHNPDNIPAEDGGPAVLVGDSDNDRVVEYQRTAEGEWSQSWVWRDARLQWARDADRLPNGHTLVTDTHGNRVIEVDEAGRIVWSVDIGTAYEAERLETGDESADGPAASAAGLEGNTLDGGSDPADSDEASSGPGLVSRIVLFVRDLFPPLVVNGLAVILPRWVGIVDLLLVCSALATATVWTALEFRWSSYVLRLPVARRE